MKTSDAKRAYWDVANRMTVRQRLDLSVSLASLGMFKLTQIESDPALEEMFVDVLCELTVGHSGLHISKENRYVEFAQTSENVCH